MNSIDKKLLFDKIEAIATQLDASSYSMLNNKQRKAAMIRMAARRAISELESKKHQSQDLYNYTITDLLSYKAPGQISLLDALNYNRPGITKPVTEELINFLRPSGLDKLILLIKSKFDIQLGMSDGDVSFDMPLGSETVIIESVENGIAKLKIVNQGAGCNEDINNAINETIVGKQISGLTTEVIWGARCNAKGVSLTVDLSKCEEIVEKLRTVQEKKFLHSQQVNKAMGGFIFGFEGPKPSEKPNISLLFGEFISELLQGMSEESRSSSKGKIMSSLKNMMNVGSDLQALKNALHNVLALALQRDRNAYSLFSTTTTGDAALALLKQEKYRPLAELVRSATDRTDQEIRYRDLRKFVMGKNQKDAFYTRHREETYHVLGDSSFTANNQPSPSFLSRHTLKQALAQSEYQSYIAEKLNVNPEDCEDNSRRRMSLK